MTNEFDLKQCRYVSNLTIYLILEFALGKFHYLRNVVQSFRFMRFFFSFISFSILFFIAIIIVCHKEVLYEKELQQIGSIETGRIVIAHLVP